MAAGPSLGARALLALVSFALFYVLALAISAALVSVPFAIGTSHIAALVKLGLPCWIAAGIVLWSVFPRIDRFPAPGPRLVREQEPRLFEELDAIARAAGQRPPDEVYLVGEANAFVAQRGGWMGIGSLRVMGLGLPLLAAFSAAEMRGVIAHEYGHFTGGDTRLGPWIYKTREALARTVHNLERGNEELEGSWPLRAVRLPFLGYLRLFLRVTQAVSRAQELAADQLGARIAGSAAMISGFRRLDGVSAAFAGFVRSELAPVLRAGFRAPLAAGFREFLESDTVRGQLEARRDAAAQEQADPYDSHPPLPERIRALEAHEVAGELPADACTALDWLADLDALERELVAFQTQSDGLELLDWSQVPARVLRPNWEAAARSQAALLRELRVSDLAAQARDPAALARRMGFDARGDPGAEPRALWLLGAALGSALARAGWELHAPVGALVELRSGARALDPVQAVLDLADGKRSAEDWAAWCAAAGVAELSLAEEAQPG